jgi:Flp pilus assembly protein TadG
MIAFFKKLRSDRRGNVIAITAACMPLIIGAAGLAVDTVQWTLWKRQLQRAADSAAMAAVFDRSSKSGATTTVAATVAHDVTLNFNSARSMLANYPQVKYGTDCPTNSGTMTNVTCVTLAVQQRLPFSAMFMSAPPIITTTATAATISSGGAACIEALETGSTTAITFTGSSEIDSPDCDVFSNSKGADSAVGTGSARVKANSIGSVGGIAQSNRFTVNSYKPYSPAMSDPFAGVTPAASEMIGCTDEYNEDTVLVAGGVNCFSSMKIGSNKTAKPIPNNIGPIYISGGDATLQGNLSCTGCTIVLTNKSAASPIGSIKMNAGVNLNMTPPTSGTYKGIAIYQDRRASDCNSCNNKINGNSSSIIQGALYFPNQELDYNGSGTTNAICTMFVARRIKFSGNSDVSNKFSKLANCGAYGMNTLGNSVTIIRLVG